MHLVNRGTSMNYFIKQIKEKDCAFTSLKMIMAIVHRNKDYLYYNQDIEDHSYSLKDIINIARKENIILNAYRIEDKEELLNDKNFPKMLIFKENNLLHMVVLKKITKFGKYIIYDPKKGIIKIKKDELFKLRNGEFLEISKVVGQTNFKIEKKKIINKNYVILSSILQIISFIILSISIFFIDSNYTFLAPIILFSSYILFEMLHKQITIKGMKEFDKRIIENINENREYGTNFYTHISKFKMIYFTSPISIISISLSIILFVTVLGINSYLNLINIGILFILNIIFHLLFLNKLKNKENRILKDENAICAKRININLFKNINDETYKLANMLTFKKYIMIFIAVILSLFYAGFANNISLNFFLFHLFSYLLLNELCYSLLEKIKILSEYRYYYSLYLNYLG